MIVYVSMPDRGVELEFLAEILDTCESEIQSWCEIISSTRTEQPEYRRIEILHDGKAITLDHSTVLTGINRLLKDYNPRVHKGGMNLVVPTFGQICEWLIMSINDGDTSMVDADVADAIIQYGVLGSMEYS